MIDYLQNKRPLDHGLVVVDNEVADIPISRMNANVPQHTGSLSTTYEVGEGNLAGMPPGVCLLIG
jgi:hypothetical protein